MLKCILLAYIAPTWTKAFEKWARLNFHEKEAIKRELLIEHRCIVGEAWGWKDDYLQRCEECAFFGYSFMFVLNGNDNILDAELLERKGNEFSTHFFEKHVQCLGLTRKTRKRKTGKH